MGESYILGGVEVEEYMSMMWSLQKLSTAESLNTGLDGAVVVPNKIWSKIEKGGKVEVGLSMVENYTQVENGLELRLRYLKAL